MNKICALATFLDGAFSKTNLTLELLEDGGLKSINSTQTGREFEGIKTFLAAFPLFGLDRCDPDEIKSACDALKDLLPDKVPTLTIVHRGTTNFEGLSGPFELTQATVPSAKYESIKPIFGTVVVEYQIIEQPSPHTDTTPGGEELKWSPVEPARAEVTALK